MKAKKDDFNDNLDEFKPEDLAEFEGIEEHFDDESPQKDAALPEEDVSAEPDEWEHDEDGFSDLASVDSNKKSTGLIDLIKENWLYLLIGLVVVAIAGYIIMGALGDSSSTPQTQAPQATQRFNPTGQNAAAPTPGAPAAPQPGVPGATPAIPTTTISMTETQMDQLMQGFSSTVQSSMKSVQKEIQTSGSAATNQKLATVENQLSNLNDSVANLNQTLAIANARLNATQQQLSTVLGAATADQEKLTLRATVPGRAWLVNDKGQTISVTVGSSLGNIGLVTAIDSDAGTVTTSSGYIFK